MFTPTKQQLEELEFREGKTNTDWIPYSLDIYVDNIYENRIELFTSNKGRFFLTKKFNCCCNNDFNEEIYPESIEDLKSLIRMLTPPNN